MKTIGEYLLYAFAGAGLVLGAGYWFSAAGFDFRQLLMLVLGVAFVSAAVFLLRRDAKTELKRSRNARKQKKSWEQCFTVAAELSFDGLSANFQALSKLTDEAVAEVDFLSWNSGAFAEIRMERVEGADWLGVFWLRSDGSYTDAQLGRICRASGMQLPAGFRKLNPHGVAIYRQGRLSIYPATLRGEFETAFLDTVLLPPEAFGPWLADYTAEAQGARAVVSAPAAASECGV